MRDKVITCNKEKGSFSQLWGRDCWVADAMLSLVQVEADRLFEQSENKEAGEVLMRIEAYCKELRAKNIEHWYDTITTERQP